MNDMRIGSLVSLRSGGPKMTIRSVINAETAATTGATYGYHVDWIDESGRPYHGTYLPEQLMVVEENSGNG